MSFATPGYLLLLVLAPLAGGAYLLLARWRSSAMERFAPGRRADDLPSAVSPTLRTIKAALVVAAVALIAIALARPQIGKEEVVFERAGADVVIALDVSRSMLTADVEPSRLALAQREVAVLLERLRGHRVGLVVFARSALLRAPLTTDTRPVQALVEAAETDRALLEPGSDLGAALREATRALRAGSAEAKVIILVSDGEDHEGGGLAAARDAAGRGVIVFAAGVGSLTGGAVPAVDPRTGLPIDPDAVTETDGQDIRAPVISRLDEQLLRRMSATSIRGAYTQAESLPDLASAVNGLERSTLALERREQPVERFQWLVLAAFALLFLEVALPEGRRALPFQPGQWLRRLAARTRLRQAPPSSGVALLAMFALLIAACTSTATADLIADGNAAYQRGDYGEALEAYLEAGALSPELPEPHLNAGLALHRLGRFDEAVAATARALPIDDPGKAAQANYSLGNHYLELGRFSEAFISYREALLFDPDHEDAKLNLELVLRALELQLAERQSDPDDAGETGRDGPPQDEANEGPGGDSDTDGGGGGTAVQTDSTLRELAATLGGLNEALTVDEALKALDLVEELYRLRPVAQRSGTGAGAGRPDY